MQIISNTVGAGNVENWRVPYLICGGPVPELGPFGPPSLGYVIRSLVEHAQRLQRWLSSPLPPICSIYIYPQTLEKNTTTTVREWVEEINCKLCRWRK